jgi:phage FluMu protein Com
MAVVRTKMSELILHKDRINKKHFVVCMECEKPFIRPSGVGYILHEYACPHCGMIYRTTERYTAYSGGVYDDE